MKQTDFINKFAPIAIRVQAKYNLPASLILAQAALESGWGNSSLSQEPYFNFFGMKLGSGAGLYSGKSINMRTREVVNNDDIYVMDNFRTYTSPEQSFTDLALRHQRFNIPLENASGYEAVKLVSDSGYATSPLYATVLKKIISDYDLTRFDSPAHKGAYNGLVSGAIGGISKAGNIARSKKNKYLPYIYIGASVLLIIGAYELYRNTSERE